VAVWVSEEGSGLAVSNVRWCEEVRTPSRQELAQCGAVIHAKDELRARSVGIGRWRQRYGRLALVWFASHDEQEPVAEDVEDGAIAWPWVIVQRRVQHTLVPLGAGHGVLDDEHVRQRRRFEPVHARRVAPAPIGPACPNRPTPSRDVGVETRTIGRSASREMDSAQCLLSPARSRSEGFTADADEGRFA